MAQSIFRIKKDKDNPYVILNKQFLNNSDLTLKGKGLLTYLLSLPDDWKIYEDEIVKHHKDGKASVRSAIKELISTGYIERERIRNSSGQLNGYNYYVYEVPTTSENPKMDKPLTVNSTLLSNNSTNNKVSNTYISLPTDGYNSFFKIYEEFFYRKFKKKHMKLSEKNMEIATGTVGELLEAGVDVEEFTEAVREHFRTLAKTNNGNILAFLKASRRNLDRVISYY